MQTLPGTGFPQVVVQAVQNVVQTCVSFPPPPAVQAGLDKFASLARLPDAEDVIETEGGWVVEAIPNRLWSTVEQLEPVGNWWLRTMQATSNYADSIQKLSGLEARVAFGRELQSFAEKLFGR